MLHAAACLKIIRTILLLKVVEDPRAIEYGMEVSLDDQGWVLRRAIYRPPKCADLLTDPLVARGGNLPADALPVPYWGRGRM